MQSVVYLPHFFSWVLVVTFFVQMLGGAGLFADLMRDLGFQPWNIMTNPDTFILLVTAEAVWKDIGWGTIVFLAALSTLDQNLYEAAAVDGTNWFQRFLHVTLPQLRPVIISMAVLDLIWTSQQFALIWMMTGGGPLNATEMLSTFTYKQAFSEYEFATASAAAVLVLLLTMILAFFYVRQQRER